MKKTYLFASLMFVTTLLSYNYFSKKENNDLFLANVEALSQDETVQWLDCSEAVCTKGCYREGKYGDEWVCQIVTEVREYQVAVGSPIICYHASISSCPPNRFEK